MAKSFNARMKDRFAKITSDYNKINAYVHQTAMMIAAHAKEHGDCSTAQGLVMAMPASSRREMLILWFATFTPIVVKNSDSFVASMHKPASKMFRDWNLEAGDEKPFYELAKEHKEQAPKDVEALIAMFKSLGPRIERMIEKGEVEQDAVPTATELAAYAKNFKFKRVTSAANSDETPKLATEAA